MTFGAPSPYSTITRGDLKQYLLKSEGSMFDNLFFGADYFFKIQELEILIPKISSLLVNNSPGPDIGYLVNADFLLMSSGYGDYTMSFMGAKECIYNPEDALKDLFWSIHGLNLWDDFEI